MNTNISYLFLPKDLSTIYRQETYVATLEIHPENPYLHYKDDFIYSNRTIYWCHSKTITDLRLDDEVDVIEEEAFSGLTLLKYIYIKQLKSIKNGAFFGCNSLISLKIESIDTIDLYAFMWCTGLKYINQFSFFECPNIAKLIMPKTLKAIDPYAFPHIPKCVIVEGNDQKVKKMLGFPESIYHSCPIETKSFKVMWLRIQPFSLPIFVSLKMI